MFANRFRVLLAGDAQQLAEWTREPGSRWICWCLVVFGLSCAIYGATFGLWRSELQAVCTAIKFPLVVFLTCLGNAMLNGCLAMILGTGMSFRQSSISILMSFTIMGIILAAFAPVMLFILWNTPAITSPEAVTGKSITLLSHVALISLAGFIGNHRLWQLLRHLTGNSRMAGLVLFAWLFGNLLLGSQISWVLRPWIGTPGREVRFFSPEPMRGNFFEAMWSATASLIFNKHNKNEHD